MDNIFRSREVIIFLWSALISSMFFSNVVSGLDFVSSTLMFKLICSNFLSNDVVILKRYFACTMNCGENLFGVSLITLVTYERHSVFELIGISYSSFCFDFWYYFSWNPSNCLLVVQNFDQIYHIWIGIWSQSDPQKMEFKR